MSHNIEKQPPYKMSLEQALEEERKEILQLLEAPRSPKEPRRERRTSPAPAGRSVLEAPSPSPAHRRYGSIAGTGVGVTPAANSSPLASSSPWTNTLLSDWDDADFQSDSDSPEQERRSSDSVTQVPREKERAFKKQKKKKKKREVDIDAGFLFGMQPTVPHIVLPKHAGPGRPDPEPSPSVHPRKHRTSTTGERPLTLRSSPSNNYLTDSGRLINMDHAYVKLSDAALARSNTSLSSLSKADASGGGEAEGNVRLAKDKVESADENSEFVDSSEDEADETSSEEESHDIRKGPEPRGRRKEKAETSPAPPPGGWSGKRGPGPPTPGSPARPTALSLLHELEEEEELVAPPRRGRRRSVLSPGPRKHGVHPNTSFDHNTSALNTPVGSDDEADLSDIKHAQNLSIHMSSVDNTFPDRAIRTIIRGDFPRFQQEADEGLRRQRKYLVATDLSDESVYALEWTIGTILRDGDTLFAVYAIGDESAGASDVNYGAVDGAKMIQDTADVVGKQTEKTTARFQNSSSLIPHALAAYFGSDSKNNSRSNSVDTRVLSRNEDERSRAIEGISQTCVRLLRKTMLQVRVAVEVIHCKTPKYLLTDAIDGLEPTLVILGSRGRSSLRGVLLGSFSNYIVTKSSVPVMVARKKLKKHSKKTRVRLSNNLTTPRSLAMAKID